MSDFNYIWSSSIIREIDSDTHIDLTNPKLLKQSVYTIFNTSEQNVRIFFDGGVNVGIEYVCNDADATTDQHNITDMVLSPKTAKSFVINRWGIVLQVKD